MMIGASLNPHIFKEKDDQEAKKKLIQDQPWSLQTERCEQR